MRRRQDTSDWEDIGPSLTEAGWDRIQVTDILRFSKDGKITELKVMRMNRRKGKCLVKPVRTYTLEEVEAMGKASRT